MHHHLAEPDGVAPDIFELHGADHFLVWAIRKIAFRCGSGALVQAEFRRACGDRRGDAACAAFRDFLRLLARHGRRPLALGPPGWYGTSHDEWRLLQLFAAAQTGSEERARMLLAWFLPVAALRNAEPRVALIATALRERGQRLAAEPLRPESA